MNNTNVNDFVNFERPVITKDHNIGVRPTQFSSSSLDLPKSIKIKSSNEKRNTFNFFSSILIILILIILIIIISIVVLLIFLILEKNVICRYGKIDGKCIECGMSFTWNKIIGGQNAKQHSWPSIAFIVFKYYIDFSGSVLVVTSTCGGTLVSQDTVVTAAHCFTKAVQLQNGSFISVVPNKYNPTYESMYTVHLGLHNKTDMFNSVSMSVKSFQIHPKFDQVNIRNDIGIIKLSDKVVLNDRVQIACLPHETDYSYPLSQIKSQYKNAYILGWGLNSTEKKTSPDILQEALISVYNSSKCSSVATRIPKDWKTQICAGNVNGGVDTCQGDSGGPLFVEDVVDNKKKFVLAGLTSFGEGCAQAQKPGYFFPLNY